jgi:hypothetical protein
MSEIEVKCEDGEEEEGLAVVAAFEEASFRIYD